MTKRKKIVYLWCRRKNDDPKLVKKYKVARIQQYIAKTTLNGLQYDR